jgi:hypothetical protein
MRYVVLLLSVILGCVCFSGCQFGEAREPVNLLGEGLDGWGYFLADENVAMEDVWSFEDGVLVCKGEPLGYIYTEKECRDFVLRLEWRRPAGKEPGKGGILVRTVGPDQIWPKSLEAQINYPDAGDFWGLIGYELSGPAERMKVVEHETFGKLTNVKKAKDAEKPIGEWNSYEIIAAGDTVTLVINGEEVNRATGCDVTSGRICLTSEGHEIHFRNITLVETGGKP